MKVEQVDAPGIYRALADKLNMPLAKVNNVSFDVSAAGRILNYGMLTIDSASDEALIINDVPNVEDIQREVNRLHEEDDERRRRSVVQDYTQDIRSEDNGGGSQS